LSSGDLYTGLSTAYGENSRSPYRVNVCADDELRMPSKELILRACKAMCSSII